MSDKRLEVNKAVHESMNIKNKANVITVICTVISPLKVMVKRKTCVSEITSQESGIRRGVSAKDEVEKEKAGEVEKERGVMPEDEEVKADGGEVEKILMRTYLLNTVLQE